MENKKNTATNNWESLCNKFSLECETWLASNKKNTTTELVETLDNLGNIIAYSVLNKCIDPQKKTAVEIARRTEENGREFISNSGCNETIVKLKTELTKANIDIAVLKKVSYKPHETIVDKDGNEKKVIRDKDEYKKLNDLARDTIGNGIDFKQESIASLLELSEKQFEEIGYIDIMKKYVAYVPNRKLWYKDIFEEIELKETETSIIQETFRAVRRLVENDASPKVELNGYGYVRTDIHMDNGTTETVYKRLKHYHDNGSETSYGTYTTDSYGDYDTMIDKLELTARQAQVLNMRLQGMGTQAIGKKLGISEQAVRNILAQVGKKAISNLDLPSALVKKLTTKQTNEQRIEKRKKLTDENKDDIRKLIAGGNTYSYIASLYNVSKMTISRIANNK